MTLKKIRSIYLDRETLKRLDRYLGERRRSDFICEVLEDYMKTVPQTKNRKEILTISMPPELIEKIKKIVDNTHYTSMTELIRGVLHEHFRRE